MKTKKTSKRLATIAGKYLEMTLLGWMKIDSLEKLKDTRALAASVLSQYESEQPKKGKVK
jgi:hypothetical protein